MKRLVAASKKSISAILGSPDVLKFRWLIDAVSKHEIYPSGKDSTTLDILRSG
jgi:hypothetical protein